MTTIVKTTARHSAAPIAHPGVILRLAGLFVTKCSRYLEMRRTRLALYDLDDRLLDDIGLDREQLGPRALVPPPNHTEWR